MEGINLLDVELRRKKENHYVLLGPRSDSHQNQKHLTV